MRIIHICDWHKHFENSIKEYIKRLWNNIEIITIKPVKHTEIGYIKRLETEKIIEKLNKFYWTIILCDERWKWIWSIDFSKKLENYKNQSEKICFIIGGSYGVDIELLKSKFSKIELLKLSEMVLPHSLAFLVLIEQIYRAGEITKWSGYHHI